MCDLNRLVCKYIHPVDVTHTNIVRMELAVCYVNTYIQLSVVLCYTYTVFSISPPSGVGSVMWYIGIWA